jgi:hypothetical protein
MVPLSQLTYQRGTQALPGRPSMRATRGDQARLQHRAHIEGRGSDYRRDGLPFKTTQDCQFKRPRGRNYSACFGLTTPSVTEIRSTFVALRRWVVRAWFADSSEEVCRKRTWLLRSGRELTRQSLDLHACEQSPLTTTVVTSFVAVDTVAIVVASPETVTGTCTLPRPE